MVSKATACSPSTFDLQQAKSELEGLGATVHIVEIDVTDGALVIRKAPGQPQLDELCSGITAENLHSEADWGGPQGKEVW